MGNHIKEIESFDYDNILGLDNKQLKDNTFILHDGQVHTVSGMEDGNVILDSGSLAREEFLAEIFTITIQKIDYVVLYYINTSKIVVLYKDIQFVGSYYGDPADWMKRSISFVNDYFKNIIDEKTAEAVDAINVDATDILAIVDKYDLPNSRDYMLVRAIEKYASEMNKLLESIHSPDNKKLFDIISDKFKALTAEGTMIGEDTPKETTPKKTTRTRKATTKGTGKKSTAKADNK